MKKICLILFLTIFFIIIHCMTSYAQQRPKGKLIVFHAGSLSVPFAKIEKAFEEKYPEVDVMREAGGSTKMARLISEVGKPADVMAAADYTVIDDLLIPKFTAWEVRFASNQLVLCYTPKSRYSDKVNSKNWYKILQKKGVIWGQADPNLDPCGYRALMVMQLAERFYGSPGLYNRLLASRSEAAIRPKSVELISLLKTGNIDYAWEYLSVAVQHGLEYVKLPDEINLGNSKFDSFYKLAKVKVAGRKPGTWTVKIGKSCTYGVTILKNSANKEAAVAFVEYLIDPEGGLKILQESGQPPIIPCLTGSVQMYQAVPDALKKFVRPH